MAQLKAGHIADFTGSMAEAMEKAMQAEWKLVKGEDLPTMGQEDRRILFVAVARGILQYLRAHQNEIMTNITADTIGTRNVTALTLNIPTE